MCAMCKWITRTATHIAIFPCASVKITSPLSFNTDNATGVTPLEYFKDIPGYEGLYQVSNHGRIANIKRGRELILRPVCSKRFGYKVITLCKDRKAKIHRIHRLVLRAFRGDSTLSVNHKDFDRGNNNLSNLEYITAKENTRHAVLAGRHPTAKRKLTHEQIREIRSSDECPKVLGHRYGISYTSIYGIRSRKAYTDVE